MELGNKWISLVCHKRVWGVGETKNATERVICRSKIRYKTVRGYKEHRGDDERDGADTVGVEWEVRSGCERVDRGVELCPQIAKCVP